MTSADTELQAPPRKRRLRRWLGAAFAVVLLVLVSAATWVYVTLHRALPQIDGTLTVPGLKSTVEVIRDQQGVPTIRAENLDDLFFAQGFVTAQDRMWEMDVARRASAGELAEILGEKLLEFDRTQRILGMRPAAQKTLALSSPEDQAYFADYARGVNAYAEAHRDRLPLEFRLLSYSFRPWTPEDTALVAVEMVRTLNHDPHPLTREKFLAALGPELTADLYVNRSWHDRPPTVQRLPQKQSPQGSDEEEDEEEGEPLDGDNAVTWVRTHGANSEFQEEPAIGSNNWVVSGAHSVTGKPLLSNDMHLQYQIPNLWYEAHLKCGKFDVAGVTLPGVPYVIVGHNARVAWGFTNLGPTVQDLYIESFNIAGEYQTPAGWKSPEHRREVIRVKGAPDVVEDVVVTRHGPLVTKLYPGEKRQIALHSTMNDGVRNPFFAVNSAQNWQEFRKAFEKLDAPAQNVVYADVDGNIGYQATGRIPIRKAGDGSLPVSGADDAHEWIGYVPYQKLPSVRNPEEGVLATANGRISPDKYGYALSAAWEAPWRTERIYRVLESGKRFSSADMLDLQNDLYSAFDQFVAERIVQAADASSRTSTRARQAAAILRNWDGRMSADSAAPSIVKTAREKLAELLLGSKLKNSTLNWKQYRWGMQTVWLENVIRQQPQRWLPQGFESFTDVLAEALNRAVADRNAPRSLTDWRWGKVNQIEIAHPVLSRIPVLKYWSGPGAQPQSGSTLSVKAVSNNHGPSERLTVDLADLDHSTLNIVTGQSGNLLSPFSSDQWRAWYEGFTFSLPFSEKAVEAARAHTLALRPE